MTKKEDTATKPSEAEDTSGKKFRHRKDMPSVAYMLKHGNPETAHLPKTKMEIYGYPVILAIIFAISLLIFHHAPHDKSLHKPFKLPQREQAPHYQSSPQQGQPDKILDEAAPKGEL
jgi:hypothetical protein